MYFLPMTKGVSKVASYMIALAAAWTKHMTAISNSTDRHASPHWPFIRRCILMGFTPSLLKNMNARTLFFGAYCKWSCFLYTTTAPSYCIPASYCYLSATLQTMSIIIVNLQDNRAVFWIFIALSRFSFDSPLYTFLYWCMPKDLIFSFWFCTVLRVFVMVVVVEKKRK